MATPGSTIYPGDGFRLNMDASTHLDVERAKWCILHPEAGPEAGPKAVPEAGPEGLLQRGPDAQIIHPEQEWCLGSWCIGRCLGTWCPGQAILVSIGGGVVGVTLLFCVGMCYCRRRRRRHHQRNPRSVPSVVTNVEVTAAPAAELSSCT